MLKTHEEIKKWLDQYEIRNYIINPNGVVDVNDNVMFHYDNGKFDPKSIVTIPIKFGIVTGSFSYYRTSVSSIKSAPSIIGGSFHCNNSNITSLSGVDKIVKQIRGRFIGDENQTHLLGLLLIPGITTFRINDTSIGLIDKIMNKYLGTGDILSAQDELIDAGLIDQARL
jgi:hypothetical protein